MKTRTQIDVALWLLVMTLVFCVLRLAARIDQNDRRLDALTADAGASK